MMKVKTKKALTVITSIFLLFLSSSGVTIPGEIFISNFENVMGTTLEIKLKTDSREQARLGEEAVIREINRLSRILSGYDPQSEFSQWFATYNEQIEVSDELIEILSLFDQWKQTTQGAIDPSVEGISQLWKKGAQIQEVPSDQDIADRLSPLANRHWVLNREKGTAIHLDNVPVLLNSFTKSYIIDKAADKALMISGVQGIVINAGGDIVIKGDMKELISVTNPIGGADNVLPMAKLNSKNKAVATSGNYMRGFQIGEHWYSHIIDPRSGRPSDHILSATVASQDAVVAGALATAFNVLEIDESLSLASKFDDLEYFIITREGDYFKSDGWALIPDRALLKSNIYSASSARTSVAYSMNEAEWDESLELTVDFEINQFANTWYRRPYLAIWIEDVNKRAVKTLAIWGGGQYRADLRYWFRVYRERSSRPGNSFGSASSATRPPGKYTLKWDGTNDDGVLVKEGTYTVCIESARENGPHELARSVIEFNGEVKQVKSDGNGEFSSITFDYHKVR